MIFSRNLLRAGGFLSLTAAATAQNSSYVLADSYDTSTFFDGFEFFTGPDPTSGFVDYVDASTANATGLAGYANNGIYLGVDYQTANPPKGRQSVRLSTRKSYTRGLIIADIAHQPAQACGAWPAFWTVGPNWPHSGEIDIIEGVNMQETSAITLHTGSGCKFSKASWSAKDCGSPGDASQGCGKSSQDHRTYGAKFNEIGGGVYAVQWTSNAINVFFFPRSGSIPADLQAGSPDPSKWGTPLASFSGGSCDIDSFFSNHQIVFDTTFCGQWAGTVWNQDAVCAAKAPTCQEYVAKNPADFQEAYWLINYVKVFNEAGVAKKQRAFAKQFIA
ncbi:glycoside hydrolase family 16 protein [Xylariaceae sp. FL0594]|nr:glycoside hydrolase family 16 protein [Xylariaceae sp. FL0594]